jgi:DNA-binding transcriptional ArsR family regulator
MQMPRESVALDRMFRALSDPSRRDIVGRLVRRPASISELARPYPMSMSAVLQHLKVLERSGLVRSEKVGRVRTCRVEPRALDALDHWVTDHRVRLQRRLDRLEAYLAKEGS